MACWSETCSSLSVDLVSVMWGESRIKSIGIGVSGLTSNHSGTRCLSTPAARDHPRPRPHQAAVADASYGCHSSIARSKGFQEAGLEHERESARGAALDPKGTTLRVGWFGWQARGNHGPLFVTYERFCHIEIVPTRWVGLRTILPGGGAYIIPITRALDKLSKPEHMP